MRDVGARSKNNRLTYTLTKKKRSFDSINHDHELAVNKQCKYVKRERIQNEKKDIVPIKHDVNTSILSPDNKVKTNKSNYEKSPIKTINPVQVYQDIVNTQTITSEKTEKYQSIDIDTETMMIQAKIKGKPKSILIDTGASVSAVSEQWMKKNPKFTLMPLQDGTFRSIIAVNKQQLPVTGYLTLEIGISNELYYEKVYVVKGLAYDVVLGRDFLTRHNCIIDFRNKSLCFPQGETIKYPEFAGSSDQMAAVNEKMDASLKSVNINEVNKTKRVIIKDKTERKQKPITQENFESIDKDIYLEILNDSVAQKTLDNQSPIISRKTNVEEKHEDKNICEQKSLKVPNEEDYEEKQKDNEANYLKRKQEKNIYENELPYECYQQKPKEIPKVRVIKTLFLPPYSETFIEASVDRYISDNSECIFLKQTHC